jgi:succinate dehydrogenase/fumarate reductase flavoprotein subunit
MSVSFDQHDVVIIGSGAAGLRAAIAARAQGVDVCVISKGSPGKGTSTVLSGGVFAGSPPGQSPQRHLDKTLQAGRGINQPALVETLVAEGPARHRELLAWGLQGELIKGNLYAKGRAPIWGEEIVRCLKARCESLGVKFMSGLLAVDLVVRDGQAAVLIHSASSNAWHTLAAKALILASGGAGALYRRHDNPQRMLGEGYALALKAGAMLQDMEFIQFYPLALAEPGVSAFLIPPRLADCGRIVNSEGEDILDKYHIHERPAAERARDRLSQALFTEIYRHEQTVWLDLQKVSEADWLAEPFAASTRTLLGERHGAKYRPVRIAPVAHHEMGGVCIAASGATSVPGLFAAGEVCGGVHGANRMGGNALTETLVFGKRAGEAAAFWAQDAQGGSRIDAFESPRVAGRRSAVRDDLAVLKQQLRDTLWRDGGIVRNGSGMNRATQAVAAVRSELEALAAPTDPRLVQPILELKLGSETAEIILQAALRREESRGAHFREDFPEQDDDAWLGHLTVRRSPDGEFTWQFQKI